jgi:hypothetical protein
VLAFGETPSERGNAFRKAARMLGLDGKRIGVEPRQLRLLEFGHVKAGALDAEFPDASLVLSALSFRRSTRSYRRPTRRDAPPAGRAFPVPRWTRPHAA